MADFPLTSVETMLVTAVVSNSACASGEPQGSMADNVAATARKPALPGAAADGSGEASGPGERVCTIETLRPGDSTNYPKQESTVRVHYEGFLAKNKKLFDSSRQRGRPFEFRLGVMQVIAGWEEAIPTMSRGQIIRVTVPSEKAYGITGYPPIIPPDSDLIFEIELLSFVENIV